MRRLILYWAAISICGLLPGLSQANAQGLSALLDKLDEMEARIQSLETKVQPDKANDKTAALGNRLEKLESRLNSYLDDNQTVDIEKMVTELTLRIDKLEKRAVNSDEVIASANPQSLTELRDLIHELRDIIASSDSGTLANNEKSSGVNRSPVISGLFKTLWEYNVNDGRDNENDFSIYYGRVSLKGDMTENIGYQLQVDFARDSDDMLLDAFAFFNPTLWSKITVGQFKSPYSTVNLRSAAKQRFISKPLMASKTAPKSRDIGLSLSMAGENYSTVFGVFNGVGQNQPDDNTAKNLAGRITYDFSPSLSFSGNAYYGKTNQADSLAEDLAMYNGGAIYSSGNFSIEGEYGYYETDNQKRTGYFVDAIYEYNLSGIVKSITPGVRYDWYDPSDDVTGDIETRYTVGMKLKFAALSNMHFRVDYLVDETETSELKDKQILSEIQVTF